ncbi:alpha/beta hydrolase family esterase [Piscinibacter sp.]|jgi:poly(hydroxyalkanoate) depolymerase family esterase|uniref:extracellular catalytic domain type 1 short-chain-length polyhydroxyalkanoate depolymerase n=1 Tax=Piscinibacter sp. TaxID=1903157 RepID=UPI00355A3B3D
MSTLWRSVRQGLARLREAIRHAWRRLWRHDVSPTPTAAAGPSAGAVEPLPPQLQVDAPRRFDAAPVATTEGVRASVFLAGRFTNDAGTRDYKLFIPGVPGAAPLPLLVMLHGCKQNPDDFAAGTRMNLLAQEQPCVVLYPAQDAAANKWRCWNWFRHHDQRRERGEPSIIAGMTRHIIATCAVDPRRVYVAGLSAGAAMASIMTNAYPELYAAAGIHSGLPHAAAHDLISALTAMRRGPSVRFGPSGAIPEQRAVPTIVFHGDRDTTVHPSNGDDVIEQARSSWSDAADGADAASGDVIVEQGQVPGGHAFTRTIHRDAAGRCDAEHWLVHGSGHAWSGGSASGSYTDPSGPDASREMLRFFAEHPRGD